MNVHFISIGGSVMHQLAIALKNKGYAITGTDDEIFEPARQNLQKEGLLPPQTGWDVNLVHPGLDAVILGMHAKADNPELLKAKELGLKIYSFPEYIYSESINKTRIAVGGSHGKTTTTGMIMHVLKETGAKFDYLVGAKLPGFSNSVSITNAPLIVCEADEYPASALERRPKFHFLFPHIAIITGIAWDHINVFPTFDIYLQQFALFIGMVQPGGVLIYNETDEVLNSLVEKNKRSDIRYQPYGMPAHSIENGVTTVDINGVTAQLKVFGGHNLLNLHAAYYACIETGVRDDAFTNAISTFTGAAKRLEVLAASDETTVYRDFAHAPSKVKATIDAVKQQYPDRKLVAVLELHTYSSLNENFMHEYRGAMDNADAAVVFYASHALEIKRLPPLPKEKVVAGFNKPGLEVITNREALQQWLERQNFKNANLLLMSSGNYDGLDVTEFARQIKRRAKS